MSSPSMLFGFRLQLLIHVIYRCGRDGCDRVWHDSSRRRYCSDACKQAAYRDRGEADESTVVEMLPRRSDALQILEVSLTKSVATWCFADDRDRFHAMYGHRRPRTPIPRIDAVRDDDAAGEP